MFKALIKFLNRPSIAIFAEFLRDTVLVTGVAFLLVLAIKCATGDSDTRDPACAEDTDTPAQDTDDTN